MDQLEIHDKRRDTAAALLSMIPGLGQMYKGYYGEGLLLMFLGAPLAIYSGLLLGLATFGLGLIVPLLFWVAVIVHSYALDDHSKHRFVHALQHIRHRPHH